MQIDPCSKPPRISASCHQQKGVALAISLILLAALTILGVATLTGTRLNEKITSNAQQKAIAFEVAESAIHSVWTVDDIMTQIDAIPASEYNNPAPVVPPGLAPLLSANFDQTNSFGTSVDLSAAVSVQYCGEAITPESSEMSANESKIQYAGMLADVNGISNIQASNTLADHVQRASITRPKSGRLAACSPPGV
ncbi:MAG: hypothetical protein KTR35_23925 [Gammaproteobacteria bacterium]|nr:hypothetical protein [Gammaproteobacteria bacterium]